MYFLKKLFASDALHWIRVPKCKSLSVIVSYTYAIWLLIDVTSKIFGKSISNRLQIFLVKYLLKDFYSKIKIKTFL